MSSLNIKNRIKSARKPALSIAIFAGLGLLTLAFSLAASTSSTIEPESATLTSNVTAVNDTSASGGQFIKFNSGGGSDTRTWEEMIDDAVSSTVIPNDCHQDETTVTEQRRQECRDLAQVGMNIIRNWYIDNTGFESYYDSDLGRYLTEADLEPMPGGSITESNITLERKLFTSPIRIEGDNVTIKNSKVEVGGYTYAIDARFGSNWTVERVTVEYTGQLGPTKQDRGNRVLFATKPGTARRIKALDGFSSGLRSEGNDQLWEYNFIDRVYVTHLNPDGTTAGDHNTSTTLRSHSFDTVPRQNITYRRNLLLDGTSSAFSFYTKNPDLTHNNLLFEENIFDLFHGENSDGSERRLISYCANTGNSGNYDNVRYIGNIFGLTQRPTNKGDGVWKRKCGTSGPHSGDRGDFTSGHRYIDGTSIP